MFTFSPQKENCDLVLFPGWAEGEGGGGNLGTQLFSVVFLSLDFFFENCESFFLSDSVLEANEIMPTLKYFIYKTIFIELDLVLSQYYSDR